MQMQTVDNDLSGGSSTPRPGSTESFVDAALDALSDLPADNDNAEQPRGKRKAPQADEPGDEREDDAVAEPGDEDAEGEEGYAEEETADESEHESRGSKDDPYTVKDLPKDKFIEVKVDGEKAVISFDELASGYIREQTFNKRVNKTKILADEAEAMISKARATQQQVRDELRAFLHDPDQLFDFYLASDDREKILEAAARKYAELRRLHRERPEERLAFQRQRDQERLNAEREHWEAQKRAEIEERTKKEQLARAREVFEPGWHRGLKRAGFPEPTPQLWDEVILRCNQKHARGEAVTTDDVTDFVVRAAKILELPPRGGKKRPAPAPIAEPRREAAGSRKKDPWAGKTQREKVKDPDFFLKGLRSFR